MSNLLEKKSVLKVKDYLEKHFPSSNLIQLENTARTANDAAKSLKKEVGSIVKSLLFKNYVNEFYLCLVSGDQFISFDKLQCITNNKILKANAEEVKEKTGFSIGGVPPIAHLNTPKKIFIDQNLNRFESIYAAAGNSHVVFELSFQNLCNLTKGQVADFVQ